MLRFVVALALLIINSSACQADPRYTQVLIGFNGPNTLQTRYFTDAQSVRDSWLSRALDAGQLDAVLSQVSFDTQMLLVAAVGERETATGNLRIDRIEQYGVSLTVYLLIGVSECAGRRSRAYPFAVAVVDRPVGCRGSENYFHQNFGDGCKDVQSGAPSN